MPTYDETVSQADKELNDFLNGSGQPTQDGQPTTVTPDISEDDFVDETSQPVTQEVANPPTHVQTAQSTTVVTAEQLEYERKLAEERGRAAAMAELISRGVTSPTNPVVSDQPQQQQPKPFFDESDITLTPDEQATYTPEAVQFASKIANRAVDRLLREVVSPLQNEVAAQRELIANHGAGVAKTNAQVLYSQVQTAVPDLPQIVNSQEWRDFLQEQTPLDSNIRIGDVFLGHLHRGQTNDILNIINMFKQKVQASPMQAAMAPGQSSVSNPPTTLHSSKPKMLSYAKFLDAQSRWQKGLIPYEEYARIEDIYDKAALENRIKY